MSTRIVKSIRHSAGPLALAAILVTGMTQLKPIPAGFFCVILD